MRISLTTIRKLAGLQAEDRNALFVAIWHLFCARVIFAVTPASTLIRRLQQSDRDPANDATTSSTDTELIAWALSAAARRLPWRTDCLVQAIAAKRWLDRKRVHSTFHIAAQGRYGDGTADHDRLSAHVWLEVGGRPVTGGDQTPDMISFSEV